MKPIIDNWVDFCEGHAELDSSHFYALFMEDLSDEEIAKVFSYFPNSQMLIANFHSQLPEKYKQIDSEEIPELLENLVREDLQEKKKILAAEGEGSLSDRLSSFEIRLTSDSQSYRERISESDDNSVFSSVIFDHMTSKLVSEEDKYYALLEAFYGYFGDYNLVWFYIAPLLTTENTFKPYSVLNSLRAKYGIADDCILVLREG